MRLLLQQRPDGREAPRFVQLQLQPDLLGGWTLLRETGQIGGRSGAEIGALQVDHQARWPVQQEQPKWHGAFQRQVQVDGARAIATEPADRIALAQRRLRHLVPRGITGRSGDAGQRQD